MAGLSGTEIPGALSLQDFCYYANAIFVFLLLIMPDNERLFMICFAFSEVGHCEMEIAKHLENRDNSTV